MKNANVNRPLNSDDNRLAILHFLQDYKPHGLFEIAKATGIYSGTVASRIRDLRLSQYGGYTIKYEKKVYQLMPMVYSQGELFTAEGGVNAR